MQFKVSPFEPVVQLLRSAECAARLGREDESRALLGKALDTGRDSLRRLGYDVTDSPEWRVFQAACELPNSRGGLLARIRGVVLLVHIQTAQRRFPLFEEPGPGRM